ncbi:MAG: hypothetical protein IJZ26_01230 [Clostridia bacterium]|nr:hypothetical protein [Clostridia bacterium]
MEQTVNENKIWRNIKWWPVQYTIGCDFIFYWIINVAFLTTVKGLEYGQIFTLDLIAAGTSVLLAFPCLILIAKLGNNTSYTVGAGTMLLGAILYTFGNSFTWFVIADILYYLSFHFYAVRPCILENNLSLVNKKEHFIKYSARGRLGYSIITLFVVAISGFVFDVNPYIPMYCCIGFALLNFVSSFFITDQSKSKYNIEGILKRDKTKAIDKKVIYFTLAIFAFIIIFKGCWYVGNQYTKISLQEINLAIQALTLILLAGRFVRVIMNFFNEKIIHKFNKSLMYILPILLVVGLLLLSLPLILLNNFVVQLVLIIIGCLLVTGIYDLYKLYIHYLVVNCYKKPQHLKMFWITEVVDS